MSCQTTLGRFSPFRERNNFIRAQLELTDALIVTSFYFIFLSEGGFICNAYNDTCNCSLHNKRPEQAFLFGRFSVLGA